MPSGTEFITHEFDEAIAIQQSIVESGRKLSTSHPVAGVKRQLKADLKVDERHLGELKRFGKAFGARGKREEVAGALATLAEETAAKAGDEKSEAYEAHAVLLNLKRKQQDSASAMLKIARAEKDTKMRDAAQEFEKGTRESAKELSAQLSAFAVAIAGREPAGSMR
jgi:hypothetical protein